MLTAQRSRRSPEPDDRARRRRTTAEDSAKRAVSAGGDIPARRIPPEGDASVGSVGASESRSGRMGVFPRTRLGESRCDVVAAGRGSFAPAPPNGVHAQPPADTPLSPAGRRPEPTLEVGATAGPDGGHPEPVGHAGGGRLLKIRRPTEHL